jgi:Arm DNA-binding domain
MPRVKLTKSTIDALPTPEKDIVYWDGGGPGFGVKVTPKGRKVFIVLYRVGGAGSRLRKYTIGPYGRVTLHQARVTALKIFAARAEGKDPAVEKQQARRRLGEDLVELFHGTEIRSGLTCHSKAAVIAARSNTSRTASRARLCHAIARSAVARHLCCTSPRVLA